MTAWPLDNTEYTAEAIGAWSGTRTRGVFSAENCFAVTAAGGFGVRVSPGLAWLKAADYWGIAVLETEETALTLEVGSGLLPRWAAVLLQYDKTTNTVQLVLRYGAFSDRPAKPVPVRDEYYDEILLASILQRAASVGITQTDITDERLNEAVCGVMRDGVTGIPTAQLFAQVQGRLEQQEGAFTVWFERMKGQLSEDPAGHLQLQLDELAADVQLFELTLLADGWKASGSTYTQTAKCEGIKLGYDLEAPQVPATGIKATDAALKEGLDLLCAGGNYGETLDGAMKWTCYGSHPAVDLRLRMRAAVLGTKEATQAAWVSAQEAAESAADAKASETAAAGSRAAVQTSAEAANTARQGAEAARNAAEAFAAQAGTAADNAGKSVTDAAAALIAQAETAAGTAGQQAAAAANSAKNAETSAANAAASKTAAAGSASAAKTSETGAAASKTAAAGSASAAATSASAAADSADAAAASAQAAQAAAGEAQSIASGAAASAVKLATARSINGTSFDGTADITTANWGAARTLTIGSKGKSVDGSGNVSWTLAEIGAAAASHGTHVSYSATTPKAAGTAAVGTETGLARGDHVHPAQTTVSGNAGSATKLATARTVNGTSFDGTANITTANWGTARTLTIGSKGKSVNGSAAVSWTLAEIGAAPAAEVKVFSATLLADGWKASGTTYTQTVSCTGMSADYNLEAPQVPATGVKATDAALKEGLDTLCAAGNYGETLAGQLKWTCYGSCPTVDLPLRLRRAVY